MVVIDRAIAARRQFLLLALTFLTGALFAIACVSAQSPQAEPHPVGLQLVAQGFTAPVQVVDAIDGSNRLFVVDLTGRVWIIESDGVVLPHPFLDIADRLVELNPGYDERGLFSLTFHPEFAQNGRLFAYYSAPLRPNAPQGFDHTGRISEFTLFPNDPNRADPASERIILEVDQPQFNHNGGTLLFGPDGFLYISLGDGGGASDIGVGHVEDWYEPNEGGNGQDITQNLLGSILRINVDAGAPYAIPPDNPFVGRDGLDEIYAYGLRNPYRMSFDPAGEFGLFAIDAGQELWEEINLIVRGGNYGWNIKEGIHCFDAVNPILPPAQCPETVGPNHPDRDAPLLDPIVESANSKQTTAYGLAVTGVQMYRGTAIAGLQGRLVFSTWSPAEPRGRLFYATPTVPPDTGLWQIAELVPPATLGDNGGFFILSVEQDVSGELYISTTDEMAPVGQTGRVYRLVPIEEP